MYTQCPHCDTAFRVMARDLQRDYGRVPCSGCGRDFNSLERLTEDAPEPDREADETRSIIESLEELTGPHEIRIEDTGVEWRVIEDDDADAGIDPSATSPDDPPEMSPLAWSADDPPNIDPLVPSADDPPNIDPPVSSPGPGDPPELEIVLESAAESPADDAASVRWYIEDMTVGGAAPPDSAVQERLDHGKAQESLPLSPSRANSDVQRYDDNTPLPDDFLDGRDDDGDPALPRRRAEDHIEPRSPAADEAQADLALGEPDDWMELLDEVGNPRYESLASAGEDSLADTDLRLLSDDVAPETDPDFPADIDTQFDLQAIEMGIDVTGNRELELEEDSLPLGTPADAQTGASAEPLELAPETGEQDLDTDGFPDDLAFDLADEAIAAPSNAAGDADAPGGGEWPGLGEDDGVPETPVDEEDAEERLREQAFEQELASAYAVTPDDEQAPAAPGAADDGHFVPPPTEEEMTINMLIDQDLLRLAEQQDVFIAAATHDRLQDSPHVETIIMEGEFVRTALEAELLAAKHNDAGTSHPAPDAQSIKAPVARSTNVKHGKEDDDLILDTYVKSKELVRGGRRRTDPPSYTVIGGVLALTLMLAVQVVHANRESLATWSMFDHTVGSVYRLFGERVIPDWDIRDWQFESTSGSTDEMDQVLTISSRITNKSRKSLPYPLLHVSLTDRWEEIIGSKVLEPAEYITGESEPGGRVPAGQHFTAVVRVESPSADATGFKLNVCYREAGNRVRCATEDFKD